MKTIYTGFVSQKGGVGKSVLTTLTASYLHYNTKVNITVVDADYPQHSILKQRERDIDIIDKNDYFKRLAYTQFKRINKKAYTILTSTPETAIATADSHLEKNKNNHIVFFDLPGTVQSRGVLSTLAQLDYIFIPIIADRLVLESSLSFAKILNEKFVKLKGIYLFWNQVDTRETSNNLYTLYNKIIQELNLVLLNNKILDTKKFRKETITNKHLIFRSTLFPPTRQFANKCGLEDLVIEVTKIMLA